MMNRVKNGITRNSFYDTEEDLGIKRLTDEEVMKYQHLAGISSTTNHEEYISNIKTNINHKVSKEKQCPVLKKTLY